MAIESILIAVVTLIICSAACFYVYIRQSHFEKKLMMVESILVDVRMAMDTIMTEGIMPAPAPISGPSQPLGGGGMGAPFDAEQIPEENFYSSVLAAAHEEAAAGPTGSAGGQEANSVDNILEEMNRVASADAAAADEMPALVADAVVPAPAAVPASVGSASAEQRGPNIDSMTKQELVALAEQRGLRAKKTMNRTELLNLLRTNAALPNRDSETGVDGSDIRNSLFPDAASVDGDYPVDLGQN
jgi:hypothetical protein